MTPEQKSAFIMAQAAMLNAEIAQMQAENQHRMNCGNSVAYADGEFQRIIDKYDGVLGYNAVIGFFHD